MESAVMTAVFGVLLVAAWAMMMMVVTALKDREQRSLGWFLGGTFALANYNRRHLRIFAACVLAAVALATLLLIFGGTVKH